MKAHLKCETTDLLQSRQKGSVEAELPIFGQVLHTPCPEIWYGQLHIYFSGLKENLCSCSHLKSQALNFGTRSMKYIVHGLSYVDIIQKKIRDMKCVHVTSLETYSRANFRTTYRVVGIECNIRKSLEVTKKIT